MPMTSRIMQLMSNNTSVYSSQKELETVNKGHIFVIPTEQSCD
jgi:hypothetical protein